MKHFLSFLLFLTGLLLAGSGHCQNGKPKAVDGDLLYVDGSCCFDHSLPLERGYGIPLLHPCSPDYI